jgi:hypothetical protein
MIDGLAYNEATRLKQRSMLPQGPGIYIWTIQLGRNWTGSGADAAAMVDSISAQFRQVRESRFDKGRLGPYRRVHLYDEPADLTSASVNRLAALMDSGPAEMSWALMCATLFQRPLYVGKALDFRSRLRSHFAYKTKFSQLLLDHGMTLNDCAVILCPVTTVGLVAGEDESEFDVDADSLSLSDVSTASMADGDDEEEEEDVPPGREELDKIVRFAESLVIRTIHPVFNERMD